MIPSHILGIDNGAALLAIVTLILIALWVRTEYTARRDFISARKARKRQQDYEGRR